MSSTEKIRAVDLFCGAGGLSWGLVEALREVAIEANQPTEQFLEEHIDLVGVNHWEQAIETHKENHPWARHYHDDVQQVNPREVFDEPDAEVKVLSGGIECTHWSAARGGKPVSEQKRMPAWDFLNWVQKLRPENVLVENVPEFASWGPIDEDGQPTRNGETFEQWIDSLHSLGYSVNWEVLDAADYGDATSRKRLFIMATRDGSPSMPEPTHSDEDDELPDHRPAADIIDWSDMGGSIWTRDLHDGRKQPLKFKTMRRIAEGIRRHCDDRLEPFADALDWIGRVDDSDDVDPSDFTSIEELRERVVPAKYAEIAAQALDEPFLIEKAREGKSAEPYLTKYYGTSTARPVDAPVDTITSGGNKYGLVVPQLLGQQSNSVARNVFERSAPTISTSGNLQLVEPEAYLLRQQSGGVPASVDDSVPTISTGGAIAKVEQRPMVMPRNGPRRGIHSNSLYKPEDRPFHTITAKNHDGHLVTPSMVRYSHGGATLTVDEPMPTIATEKGGVFALSSPYLCPLYNGRSSQRPRTRDIDRPLMTVPASKSPAGLAAPIVSPFIEDCQGVAQSVDESLKTQPASDRFALVVPEVYPYGLDIRYRMLQPHELQQAQGFPEDYEITGNKRDTTKQIGNAVPVNTAQSLVESLLENSTPALTDYVDDDPVLDSSSTNTSVGRAADDD